MSSQSEKLSMVDIIEENSVNSSASKFPEKVNPQKSGFELLETAKGRNFLEFDRGAREVARFYINGFKLITYWSIYNFSIYSINIFYSFLNRPTCNKMAAGIFNT